MSLLTAIPDNLLWEEIEKRTSPEGHEVAFLRTLLSKYSSLADISSIKITLPTIQSIFSILKIDEQIIQQRIINFLCFRMEILEMKFIFIDEDDQIHELNYEAIQTVLKNDVTNFGSKSYSRNYIENNTETFLIGTNIFNRLLNLKAD